MVFIITKVMVIMVATILNDTLCNRVRARVDPNSLTLTLTLTLPLTLTLCYIIMFVTSYTNLNSWSIIVPLLSPQQKH